MLILAGQMGDVLQHQVSSCNPATHDPRTDGIRGLAWGPFQDSLTSFVVQVSGIGLPYFPRRRKTSSDLAITVLHVLPRLPPQQPRHLDPHRRLLPLPHLSRSYTLGAYHLLQSQLAH